MATRKIEWRQRNNDGKVVRMESPCRKTDKKLKREKMTKKGDKEIMMEEWQLENGPEKMTWKGGQPRSGHVPFQRMKKRWTKSNEGIKKRINMDKKMGTNKWRQRKNEELQAKEKRDKETMTKKCCQTTPQRGKGDGVVTIENKK